MKTLTEYFAAKDAHTGETYAAYCDRMGIGFQQALRSYYIDNPAQPGIPAKPDRLLASFDATDSRTGARWVEYADSNRMKIVEFIKTSQEMDALQKKFAEKAAEREVVQGALPSRDWWRNQPKADPVQYWWQKKSGPA